MATFGYADYTLPRYEGIFRHNALFLSGNVRQAVQEGRADYTPDLPERNRRRCSVPGPCPSTWPCCSALRPIITGT